MSFSYHLSGKHGIGKGFLNRMMRLAAPQHAQVLHFGNTTRNHQKYDIFCFIYFQVRKVENFSTDRQRCDGMYQLGIKGFGLQQCTSPFQGL